MIRIVCTTVLHCSIPHLAQSCLQAEGTVKELNDGDMGPTTNQQIWIWWGPLLCHLIVLYFLDQGGIWGSQQRGWGGQGTQGLRKQLFKNWSRCTAIFSQPPPCAVAELLSISPASTNEKLLLQRYLDASDQKSAVPSLRCLGGAHVQQVFFQVP